MDGTKKPMLTSGVSVVRHWGRRLLTATAAIAMLPTLGALAAAPPAGAFSREGLPVEYLDVYSPSMGRSIRVQFQGRPGDRAERPEQGGLPAGRHACPG